MMEPGHDPNGGPEIQLSMHKKRMPEPFHKIFLIPTLVWIWAGLLYAIQVSWGIQPAPSGSFRRVAWTKYREIVCPRHHLDFIKKLQGFFKNLNFDGKIKILSGLYISK